MASPRRSGRAAATRRRAPVIDDSDDNDSTEVQVKQETLGDDSDDFTPAPQKSPRRTTRRKTVDPMTPSRTRRSRQSESVEPSQLFSPEAETPEPMSPTKKSPTKRKGAVGRLPRKGRVTVVEDAPSLPPPGLPTPQPSASPEPVVQPQQQRQATPLADITESTINQAPAPEPQQEFAKVDARTTVLERPMDIVVRTRNAAATAMPTVQESTEPKPRMVITYLVLTNFKSYAGRQEVGPFHASFSSVVGPNGSGKSNVIDSLLFVFGFRASKMRQGKISALIHNSAAHPDLGHCEVEVHFQEVVDLPAGGSEPVPDSAIVVSRRAFKNNSSKYYINGKESSFTIVTTMLKDRGIDLDHKRFLILQGEVESIAQMKPKAANEHDDGLLEYLEDIIGTSRYKTPIEESAAETETLNEVCLEKSGRLQHVEKEKNSLEDKKNKAIAYIRDENELAAKRSTLFQIFIGDCNDAIVVAQEAVTAMQASLEEELRKHEGNEVDIKRLEKAYRAGAKEYDRMEKETREVLKEMAKLDKETVKFEEKKKFLAGKQKKLDKAFQAAKFGAGESDTLAKQAADDIEKCLGEIKELEAQMGEEEKKLATIRDDLKGKTRGLSDQIAARQKDLEPWKAKVNEVQSSIAVTQSELDILREKDGTGATTVAEMETKIATLEESKVTKTAELEDCKMQQRQTQKELKRVEAQLEQVAKEEPALKTKLSGARQRADEARASLSATQTQGNVLSGLMRLKESGRIDGFHGRLGNLGAIDQKYDVAISTACPSLDNLVVDTVEVGQQCIDYLRKNNLGRANFILLDRLPQRDLSAISTPEKVSRLFDLVKPKHDRFRPAFYSVLQNTLVADDLEQANRIAYGAKRWRVVTLDGQLIDKSGTMSGGGTRVAKGGMSSKLAADVTKDQVSRLEVDREALENTYQELQQRQRELEASLRELRERLPQLETAEQKTALELESCDRNIADARRRIKEVAAEQQPSGADRAQMVKLEKSLAKLEASLESIHTQTAGIEEEIKGLQDKIMEIGGVQLRGQKAKVDGLKEQIASLTEVMSTAEVAQAKARKQKTKHEKIRAEAEEEVEGLAADMESIEREMKAQVRDAVGRKQQADEAQEAVELKKDQLQGLKAELDEKTAELNETRAVEIEMRNRLEEAQKALSENQRKLRHWEDKLGKLAVQNVE